MRTQRRLITDNVFPDIQLPEPWNNPLFAPPSAGDNILSPARSPLVSLAGAVPQGNILSPPVSPLQDEPVDSYSQNSIGSPGVIADAPPETWRGYPIVNGKPVFDTASKVGDPVFDKLRDQRPLSEYMRGEAPTEDTDSVRRVSNRVLPIAGAVSLLSLLGGDASGAIPLFNSIYGGATGAAQDSAKADYARKLAAYNAQNATNEKVYSSDLSATEATNRSIAEENATRGRIYNTKVVNAQRADEQAAEDYTKEQQSKINADNVRVKEKRLSDSIRAKNAIAILKNERSTPQQQASAMKTIGDMSNIDLEGPLQEMSPEDAEKLRVAKQTGKWQHEDRQDATRARRDISANTLDSLETRANQRDATVNTIARNRDNLSRDIAAIKEQKLSANGGNAYRNAKMFFSLGDHQMTQLNTEKRYADSLRRDIRNLYKNPAYTKDIGGKVTLNELGDSEQTAILGQIESHEGNIKSLLTSIDENNTAAKEAFAQAQGDESAQDKAKREKIRNEERNSLNTQKSLDDYDFKNSGFLAHASPFVSDISIGSPALPKIQKVKGQMNARDLPKYRIVGRSGVKVRKLP